MSTAVQEFDDRGLAEHVASRVVARLVEEQNELTFDPDTTSEVAQRIDLIARIVIAARSGQVQPALAALNSADLGGRRAAAEVHPSASLRAATVTFEELYPALLGPAPSVDRDQAVADAVAVQDVVGKVIFDAATGYVDHLLMRLSAVHMQERRSLAGYLHDHTAQALASALQRLDFEDVPIDELRVILEGALSEVRTVAFNLRQFVGDRRLDEALGSYLDDLNPEGVTVEIGQLGVPRLFFSLHQESTFLIIREALLNSLKHARARHVEVRLGWRHSVLTALVKDDGDGFEVDGQGSTRMGLLICRERAESMAALLEIRSNPGEGTSVELQVPL